MSDRDPLLIRLLWCVIYLFLTGVSWTMIYYLIDSWNSSIINIEVDNTVNYKEFFPFPAVTVCSTTKIAGRFNVSEAINQEFLNISWEGQRSEILNNIKLVCDEYGRIGETNVTSVEVMQFLFQYLAPSVSEVIDSDETFTPILTNHGLCFSNNMLDGREIFRENVIFYNNPSERGKLVKGWVHASYGFYSINDDSFENDEEEAEFYPKKMSPDYNLNFRVKNVPQNDEFKCKSEGFQFKVLVHNPAELPFLMDTYATTFLADQFISISAKPELISTDRDIISLDPIEKDCFSFDERYLSYFRTYTENNCIMECLTNRTLKLCNCVTFYMPRFNTTEICSAKLLNCTKYAEDSLNTDFGYCRCKPSCIKLSYNTDVFTQYWPGFIDHSSNLTVMSSSEEFFLSYSRKNIYGINALISDIGGINGFFTGLTLSSIMKFVYFFIWTMFRNLYRCVRKFSKRD